MLGYDAARWHAALNDIPAAVLLLAVLFDFGAAVFKRESLKWAGIWTLWAGVIGGWVAVVAGELAEKSLAHGEAIHDLMELHERQALVTMGIFTVILGWKMYRRFALPAKEEWVTRGLGILGVVGLVYVASIGGKLVFEHAAGIPTETIQAEIQNRTEGHEHEGGAPADTAKAATHVDPPGTPAHKH